MAHSFYGPEQYYNDIDPEATWEGYQMEPAARKEEEPAGRPISPLLPSSTLPAVVKQWQEMSFRGDACQQVASAEEAQVLRLIKLIPRMLEGKEQALRYRRQTHHGQDPCIKLLESILEEARPESVLSGSNSKPGLLPDAGEDS